MSYILGADIGGSHIACAAVEVNTAKIDTNTYTEEKVDSKAEIANDIFEAWAKAINAVITKVGANKIQGLGLAIPGPFDYKNGIALYTGANDKFASLYQKNVKLELSQRTGIEQNRIFFANDAACFGMGENWAGAGKSSSRMVGITLGTGFGTVYMKDGKHVTDGQGVPKGGELWDYPYRGTIAEDFVSTRWFVKRFNELTGQTVTGAYEVAKAYETNAQAKQVFDEFGATLVDILTPSLKEFGATSLVIGGSISKSSHLFIPQIQENFRKNGLQINVAATELFDHAAIFGAAKLVLDSI